VCREICTRATCLKIMPHNHRQADNLDRHLAVGERPNFREKIQQSLLRNRVQLLGGAVFAVLMPLIFRFGIENVPISDATLLNTIVGSLFALTTGFFFFRRLIDYPGTEGIAYAIPVFALTYGAASVIFLFLRLDYSRYVFGASYLLSVIWFTGISIAMTKLRTYRIGIVPGGDVLCLRSLPYAEWHVITDPGSIPIGLNAITADLRHSFTPEWERFVAEAAVSGTPVFDVKHLRETLTGRVQIAHLSENTLGALNPDDMYLKLKQALDWFAALVALVALAPFFALIVLAIRCETTGPAIFRQKRMGYRGRVFTLYKFRTMRMESDIVTDDRERAITREDDARITRIGRFLRRTRIDELPQLINILRGEMSWIGPRPEAVPLSEWYEKELPFYRYRHIVRPGISGWAQVMQGHVASPDEVREKLHYDFYYIKNFSPWLDILIILKTIRTVLTGAGSR
jgi:lipopolysaccharide/colanic/teichoic acid biosynthesis glycosyltransferase